MTYDAFFEKATRNKPYDYQRRLACGERTGSEHGCPAESRLISIPTGLGKTAAVVLAWLWNSVHQVDPNWPGRLVYCLPMRTLVEQTEREVRKWLLRLARKHTKPRDGSKLRWLALHSPIILMGGEELTRRKREWDIYPEKPAIIIGTQDMLLSRALNRGYGMSRYRWPMHFGLLNSDCLWVMDETQLMGSGLSTACQLEAFRTAKEAPPNGHGSSGVMGSVTWYVSATGNPEHLKTREWRAVNRSAEFEFGLSTEEKAATEGPIYQRRFAVKRLELEQDNNFVDETARKSFAAEVLKRHVAMVEAVRGNPKLSARTLIICNTVDRAVAVHTLLDAAKPEGCDLLLLHSRFRPPERIAQMKRLKATDLTTFPKGQIVVATQVIEAGVDLSSAILCTEVAPLASLVQRLGRLNRSGEFNDALWKPIAIIVGLGEEPESNGKNDKARHEIRSKNFGRCLPYELSACEAAWNALVKLNCDASPASLEQIQADIASSIPRCPYSLQRHELTDFFDTDANLSLGFTDVSPFVRGLDEDTDLQVLWRESWPQEDVSEGTGKPAFTPDFQRDELCSVPISKALKARDVLNHGWIWRGKQSGWISVRDAGIAPGMTILLLLSAGGYNNAAGWTGDKAHNKHSSHYQPRDEQPDEEQLSCLANGWRTIAGHTAEVATELDALLRHLLAAAENERERNALLVAVPWHDIGKNHPGWQQAVLTALEQAGISGKDAFRPFAKFSLSESPQLYNEHSHRRCSGSELKREMRKLRRSFRPNIAHEVASALAFRKAEQVRLGPDPERRNTDLASLLAEYVIMSHHGRVRKVLRDELPRFPTNAKDTDTVRGIAHGTALPPVTVDGQSLGCAALSTDCRKMGRDADGHESYTRGVLRLLEHYGPFRLAYFEALFRAADIRASILAKATEEATLIRDEPHRDHPPVEGSATGAQVAAPLGGDSPQRGAEHGLRAGAGGHPDPPRDTRPDRATRFVETTVGVLSYSELAPLLAGRVTRLEQAVQAEEFATRTLDEGLLLEFHQRICGDLTPNWAGQWRVVEVTVDVFTPPAPHHLPMLMRDYTLDLQARWVDAAGEDIELTLEFLAFAEGRFLSIHPFRDFNGRTIRVLLTELLRRLDLPLVDLAPESAESRSGYFAALEAGDHSDWRPLVAIWKSRFSSNS